MSSDFVFEIYSEEIPARMHQHAGQILQEKAHRLFEEEKLEHTHLEAFVTPLRLVLYAKDVKALAHAEKRKGPSVLSGEKALEAFAKSLGLQPKDCFQEQLPKGLFWHALFQDQRSVQERLIAVCEALLSNFPWPKSMRWTDGAFTWVRPIRHLLCLYGKETLDWTFAPLQMKATHITKGLKVLSSPAIAISCAEKYQSELFQNGIWLHTPDRKENILDQLDHRCFMANIHPCEEDLESGGLIDEVSGLSESPLVVLGKFDEKFLELPAPLIQTPIRVHQRCFPLQTPEGGPSTSYAIVTALPAPSEKVLTGYQRVIEARLSDALFFWKKDTQKPLEEYNILLQTRRFFEGLGTLAEKAQRLANLMPTLCPMLRFGKNSLNIEEASRAALLSKADLATSAVYEFPELQGTIGHHIALFQKEPKSIARALEEYYWPRAESATELKNQSCLGAALGIIDRLDTLVGFFALNQVPTSSKDPFALRRQVYGVLKILTFHRCAFSLPTVCTAILSAYRAQGFLPEAAAEFPDNLYQFFKERFYSLCEKEYQLHPVLLKACLEQNCFTSWLEKALEYQIFFQSSAGSAFLAAYKRLASLKAAHRWTGESYQPTAHASPQEQTLWGLVNNQVPLELNEESATWTSALNDFFDHVRVQGGEESENRYRLLQQISQHLQQWGCFDLCAEEQTKICCKEDL